MAGPSYIDILKDPSLFRKIPLGQFQVLVNHYPHVPLYRALLAAKGMQDGHPDSGKWLETAAIYASDRRQLKRLMQRWTTVEASPQSPVRDPETEDGTQSTVFIPQSEGSQQSTGHIPQAIEEVPESARDVLEQAIHVKEEIDEEGNLPEKEVMVESFQEAGEGNVIEDQEFISESAEVKPLKDEGQSIEKDDEPWVEVAETNIADSHLTTEDDEIFLKAIGKWEPAKSEVNAHLDDEWILEAPGRKVHVLKINEVIDSGLAQTDIRWMAPWLAEFDFPYAGKISRREPIALDESLNQPETDNAEPVDITPSPDPQTAVEENITEKKDELLKNPVENTAPTAWSSTHSFEEWLTILAQKQKASDSDAPIFELPQAELVANTSQPTHSETPLPPSPLQQADFSDEDVKKMAEESISLKDELATETLARIYVKQGKVQHAIKVYQILTKKYPEKSGYFAAQIRQLKSE